MRERTAAGRAASLRSATRRTTRRQLKRARSRDPTLLVVCIPAPSFYVGPSSSLVLIRGRRRLRRGATAWTCVGRLLAQLQRANISNDSPAVLNRNLRRVCRHRSPTIGHYVEEVSHRRLAQAILVIVRRRRFVEPTAGDDSISIAGLAVTNGTV